MEQIERYPDKFVTRLMERQKASLEALQSDNTAIVKETALLSAMTSELAAQRTLINHYFEKRQQDQKVILQTASNLLDISINKGNTEMADIALDLIHMLKQESKKLIFLYSDQVFVNDIGQVSVNELDIQDGNLYCRGEQIDICLSEPVIHFIEDLKKLESYEWENDYSHPVTRLSYDSRNQYMKLLLLICVWNHGISVDQIIFLSEMAQQFGMNSGRLLEFIREIRKIPDGSIADYIQQMAIHFDETEQKTVYVDIAYLIRVGRYNENQKNVRINKISKLLSSPKERTTKILYYMEKEKI